MVWRILCDAILTADDVIVKSDDVNAINGAKTAYPQLENIPEGTLSFRLIMGSLGYTNVFE